jgi:type I restriction enzyme S subunit
VSAAALPQGWTRRRLRFDARLNPVKSEVKLADDAEVSFVPMDAVGELGGLRLDEQRALDDVYTGYTYFRDGDVVIAKITPCFENGKGALATGLTNGIGFGTTELHVVRPGDTLDARFLFYMTIAHDFRCFGSAEMLGAGGQKRVPEHFLKDWRPSIPLPKTQRRLAAFLGEKTAQIDSLIEKKRASLELLAEKRQAIITQAVTEGLNPAAPMRDSGIDWLGKTPAHWDIRGLTKCTTRVDYRGATPEKSTSGVFLVTARNIKNGRIDYTLSEEFVLEDDYEHVMRRGKPVIGDVLLTTEAPLGEVAHVDRIDVALAQRIIKFSSSISALDNYYLGLWMQSGKFQFDLQSRATGSTALGIKASKIVELRCLLPPLREQREIVAHVRAANYAIDAVRNRIETSIHQLSRYRSALVTAAVTGQMEGQQ